jgi:hypothetical protein
MTVEQVPFEDQPEFDDVGPISMVDKVLLGLIWPIAWLNAMVTLPSQTRRSSVIPRAIHHQPLTAEQNDAIPPALREFFDAAEAEVQRVGFHPPVRHGDFRLDSVGAYLSILPSLNGEDLCLCFASQTPRRVTITGVVFQTRMTDGLLITTGNEGGGSSRMPMNHDAVTFSGKGDVAELYDIHRRRKARANGVPIAVGWRPPATHPLELMQRGIDESIEEAVRRGRVEAPATPEVRFTAKGALLAAWRVQWPLRQIEEWQERRRAARVLRGLGLS